ncbi:winged helix DNA-binding domain-containing protein [Leucobacter insecticola]|uniref:Winged helix DNA-binding domain-containing protein n=1 Tax=Leucobacter insecticola TaxID=2714934 RepID=A0A6G8FIY5_9MICO|nr:winged helix DNA-binding domain-containing protein [Leucobacter insecticola]QIM16298.1 winged helix DNA-binding domain-containing protein [Leucobacter insecticola]
MNTTITQAELLRLRMRAQGLAGTGAADAPAGSDTASGPARIAATASRMLALQGQDWRSSRWALGVRTPGTTVADVSAAFNTGRIVRSWPMRGTIHVLAAEDIGWMQAATNRRVLAGAAKRRAQLELSDATLERLVEVAVAALSGGQSLSRDELAGTWEEAGIEVQGPWRYHTIWWMCQNNITVLGPVQDEAEPRLVLAEEWITTPRQLEGGAALCEIATRYAQARGAVTAKDLAWWSGLTMKDARQGLRLASETGSLVELESDAADGALWADPEQLAASANESSATAWLMLPSFDEHLLGYRGREAQLTPEHFERIVPGRNGMFLATIVHEGRVVGTWKRAPGKHSKILVTPFPDAEIDLTALEPEAARWSQFHGFDAATLEMGGST